MTQVPESLYKAHVLWVTSLQWVVTATHTHIQDMRHNLMTFLGRSLLIPDDEWPRA